MSLHNYKPKTRKALWTTLQSCKTEVTIAKPRKKLRTRSKLMTQKMFVYKNYAIQFLDRWQMCQVTGCHNPATQVHHKAGRGKNLLKMETWLAVCQDCHRRIHDNPEWAMRRGYLFSRLSK